MAVPAWAPAERWWSVLYGPLSMPQLPHLYSGPSDQVMVPGLLCPFPLVFALKQLRLSGGLTRMSSGVTWGEDALSA